MQRNYWVVHKTPSWSQIATSASSAQASQTLRRKLVYFEHRREASRAGAGVGHPVAKQTRVLDVPSEYLIVGPRVSGFLSDKDGEAGDIEHIVDAAGCSPGEK